MQIHAQTPSHPMPVEVGCILPFPVSYFLSINNEAKAEKEKKKKSAAQERTRRRKESEELTRQHIIEREGGRGRALKHKGPTTA